MQARGGHHGLRCPHPADLTNQFPTFTLDSATCPAWSSLVLPSQLMCRTARHIIFPLKETPSWRTPFLQRANHPGILLRNDFRPGTYFSTYPPMGMASSSLSSPPTMSTNSSSLRLDRSRM